MNAKEYYDLKRINGETYDITSNMNPNYHLVFYQAIFNLMESYHQHKLFEITEEEIVEIIESIPKRYGRVADAETIAKAITNLLKGER